MKTNLTAYKEDLTRLSRIVGETRDIAQTVSANNADWLETLKAQKEKADSEFFRVLVMGKFNSGKSSMINALLGEKVLPVGARPATAIITEILYGERKRVVMHPKPGKWRGGDQPFEIPVEDMGKYCLIDNDAADAGKLDADTNVIESPFEKMVVYWPLPILKDGVMIIDSPGLDDPYNHDAIAQNYAPKASAVIYLVGADGMSHRDVTELRSLNELGYRSMMMVLTHFDQALENIEDDGGDPEEFVAQVCKDFACYSDLGRQGFHFVDSRSGLKAKRNGDEALLARSGYAELERFLEKYLVESKGRSIINSITGQMERLHREIRLSGDALVKTQNAHSEELKARAEAAQEKLNVAKLQGDTVCIKFQTIVEERIRPKVSAAAAAFAKNISSQLTLDGFEPETRIPTGAQRLNPMATKRAAKQLKEETLQYLKHQTQVLANNWSKETLQPIMDTELKKASQEIDQYVSNFNMSLEHVYGALDPEMKQSMFDGKSIASSIGTLILAFAGGAWWTVLLSGVYGFGTFAKTMGFAMTGSVALALITGTVVSLPVIAAITLGSAFLAIITGGASQERNIKNAALKEIRSKLDEEEELNKRTNTIVGNVCSLLDDAVAMVRNAVNTDIRKASKSIEDMMHNAKRNSEERRKMAQHVSEVLSGLYRLEDEVKEIARKYK